MSHQDTHMSNAPPTPDPDPDPDPSTALLTSPSVDFSPTTVPYNEAFENDLMNLILHPPSQTPSHPAHGSTPMIPASHLPIPLSSSLRTHPSPIPGLLTTHPHGYHTGGPGPSPHILQQFANKFIAENDVEDAGQLERAVETVMKERMAELQRRMEDRESAVRRNREVEEELESLRLQRDAEVRVLERLKGRR